MTNRFDGADTVEQLIYQAVGAASVFDDKKASETAEEALARLKELQA